MDLTKFRGKRICVAVSGGIDSVSLLHYMHIRQNEFGYALSAIHCQHGIRGEESLEDMRFVQALCTRYAISLWVAEEDCPARAKREKCSLETSARNFRYEHFARLVQEGKTDYIATAHHKNDEAETVLFRLARGTSLTGVQGMTEECDYLIRPFLSWQRAEIERYAETNGLAHREDCTNAQTDATRNKIRLQVLPALEDAVPGAVENLVRFATLAGEDDRYLYALCQTLISPHNGGYLIASNREKPLFSRACLTALKNLGVERDYTRLHLDLLFALQDKERGVSLDMPQNVQAKKTDKGIFLYVNTGITFRVTAPKYFTVDGFDGGRYAVKVYTEERNIPKSTMAVLRVDLDAIPKDAEFRFRREGDRIKTFGGHTKSLKKLLNERKIDVEQRNFLPLIAKADEVYAVCGVEIADSVKVTETTQNIGYIVVIE